MQFPRSREAQLFVPIDIGSDLPGGDSTFFTFALLSWVTVYEAGPPTGKTRVPGIAPRRQEAFDGKKSGAMMIPATRTAGLTEDTEIEATGHAHPDETELPTEMGTDPGTATETDNPAMIAMHRAKTERRERRRRRKRKRSCLSPQSL